MKDEQFRNKKDIWDKLSALSTLISGILIAGIALLATQYYNYSQLELRKLEVLDRFRTSLSSVKKEDREFAYNAFVTLGYERLAIKMIKATDDRAGMKALASLSESKDKRVRDSASKLLTNLKVEQRLGGREATLSRLRSLNHNKELSTEDIFTVLSFSLKFLDILKNPSCIEHVSRVLHGIDADILLLQEFPNKETINKISYILPDYEYFTSLKVKQKQRLYLATFIKKERVKSISHFDLEGSFARRPLGVTIKIKGKEIDIINLHLDSGIMERDRQGRAKESKIIQEWVKNRSKQRPVLISGVFNAEANASEIAVLKKVGHFTTGDLEKNIGTYISPTGKRTHKITHFLLGGGAKTLYVSSSTYVYDLVKYLPELSREEIRKEISDHNPVTIALNIQ